MKKLNVAACVLALGIVSQNAMADCPTDLGFTYAQFTAAADTAATETDKFGFGLPMWASAVDKTGKICYVYSTDSGAANSGSSAGNKAWLGSRVISAQKANTANAFSLDALGIVTGGVFYAVQNNGSLNGLQFSNPVDASVAYSGDLTLIGTSTDPLVGKNIGGINVFGGGVPLYNSSNVKVGGLGASGDTSCRDHAFAYRMRHALALDNAPTGSVDKLKLVKTPNALGEHPLCGVTDPLKKNGGGTDYGISN